MKSTLLLLILASLANTAPTDYTPAPGEVVMELSKRSGLPESDLKGLLSNCNANQKSMYFCANRDFVAVDLMLKHAVIKKEKAYPSCKSSLDAKISKWERKRGHGCKKSTKDYYGEDSLKPTAEAICVTDETKKMTKRIEAMRGCELI